jgi:hypothetical protein
MTSLTTHLLEILPQCQIRDSVIILHRDEVVVQVENREVEQLFRLE